VLNFISLSDEFKNSRQNIHENLKKLDWKKGFYRKDIAYKVISK
jgi:phosphoribosylamine--glycine ligase